MITQDFILRVLERELKRRLEDLRDYEAELRDENLNPDYAEFLTLRMACWDQVIVNLREQIEDVKQGHLDPLPFFERMRILLEGFNKYLDRCEQRK